MEIKFIISDTLIRRRSTKEAHFTMITNHKAIAHTHFSELEARLGAKATQGTCPVKFCLVEWGEVNAHLPGGSASTSLGFISVRDKATSKGLP